MFPLFRVLFLAAPVEEMDINGLGFSDTDDDYGNDPAAMLSIPCSPSVIEPTVAIVAHEGSVIERTDAIVDMVYSAVDAEVLLAQCGFTNRGTFVPVHKRLKCTKRCSKR